MTLHEQPDVLRFVSAARAYCALQEAPGPNRDAWVKKTLMAVAELYACSHKLPSIHESGAEGAKRRWPAKEFEVDDGEWRDVYDELDLILGSSGSYWGFARPTAPPDEKQEPHFCDLTRDLADMYRGLKPGLRGWDSGHEDARQAAVASWAIHGETGQLPGEHWVERAACAMAVLHDLTYHQRTEHPRF